MTLEGKAKTVVLFYLTGAISYTLSKFNLIIALPAFILFMALIFFVSMDIFRKNQDKRAKTHEKA